MGNTVRRVMLDFLDRLDQLDREGTKEIQAKWGI